MASIFRRLYTTLPEKAAAAARTSSTPRAVRIRRARPESRIPTDLTPTGLSAVEKTQYDRLKARGELYTTDPADGLLKDISEEEWLAKVNERRRRVRGVRHQHAKVEGEEAGKEIEAGTGVVVGQRIYLPNIIFRLVRNNTPPGRPYNPYEATFRIPQSLTKLDVRSYLSSVYGVSCTYIRTDNYISPIGRNPRTLRKERGSSKATYKKAVVGLESPFYYPQAREDMTAVAREARDKWLEEMFQMSNTENGRAQMKLRYSKPIHWRHSTEGSASIARWNVIKKIMQGRVRRETMVKDAVQDMLADPSVAGSLPVVKDM